jgi:two-component system osmolarity sensor histidine kinase EnvZ
VHPEELKTDAERNATCRAPPSTAIRSSGGRRRSRAPANPFQRGATRAGDSITGYRDHRWLTVTVDDDGPGIAPHLREEVFKPFLRLDDARNQDEGGTGLGLAIARDIARSHGGDIMLSDSPLGGLRATVRVPV